MSKLALFDIDWTLLRGGNPAHIESFSRAFNKIYYQDAHIKEISYEGKIDSQIIIEVLTKRGLPKTEIKRRLDSAFKVMTKYFKQHLVVEAGYTLPGAKQLPNQLKMKGVYLAALTGNIESIARAKLKAASLNNLFSVGAFGNEALRRIDLVEIARKKAEEKFGIKFSKEDTFLIGDTPLDINCGKEAKIRTIGVASCPKHDALSLQKAGAELVVPNFANQDIREKITKFILKDQ